MNTRAIGTAYEDLACEHLQAQGMLILARNYRVRLGEIDIVALDGDELVFVEVKYRASLDFGGAEYAIPLSKQRTIWKVAQCYMKQNRYRSDAFCRFDAVLVNGMDVIHIKNAWQG